MSSVVVFDGEKDPKGSHGAAKLVPVTLKWGKKTFTAPLLSPIEPGSNVQPFQRQIEAITQVPVHRQKLLARGGWKGTLGGGGSNSGAAATATRTSKSLFFPTDLSLPKGKNTLLVTLIGSAEVLVETPLEDRPKFQEDMTQKELRLHEAKFLHDVDVDVSRGKGVGDTDTDIVALQYEPGVERICAHRESSTNSASANGKMRMTNKGEMIQYNRLVTGLPQWQIEERLKMRRVPEYQSGSESKSVHSSAGAGAGADSNIGNDTNRPVQAPVPVVGEVAMTMGLELRRAYVNSLATLHDGTLVSALDDGHVQLWRRGRLVKDSIHGSGSGGGVDHVVSFPTAMSNVGADAKADLDVNTNADVGPHFATAGMGRIRIWSADGDAILDLGVPSGTTPSSLIAGSINVIPPNTNNGSDSSNNPEKDKKEKENLKFLACCCRVTRKPDPNQFRLLPQDEEGRRRRAVAEEQERHIQQSLNNASRCVQFWIYDDHNGSNSVGFGAGTIYPPSNGAARAAPAVVELAVSNGHNMIVCADAWGGLRIMNWVFQDRYNDERGGGGRRRRLRPTPKQSAQLQLHCDDDQVDCKISCLQFIDNNNILAVGTDYIQYSEEATQQERSGVIPNATLLQITNPRGAVCIIDVQKSRIRAVLHAHSDYVQCICPLPCGGILTAGAKMDATVRVWEGIEITSALGLGSSKYETQSSGEEGEDWELPPLVLTEARVMKEPGYVFDLKVLPDHSKNVMGPGGVYAIAAARYNVIKIII